MLGCVRSLFVRSFVPALVRSLVEEPVPVEEPVEEFVEELVEEWTWPSHSPKLSSSAAANSVDRGVSVQVQCEGVSVECSVWSDVPVWRCQCAGGVQVQCAGSVCRCSVVFFECGVAVTCSVSI